MSNQQKLRTVYKEVSSLRVADYNPRTISDKSLSDLKESIQRFGMVDPIIVNSHPSRYGVVIGGHMRLRAAKELGYTTIPVVFVSITDIEKEKELNLRLNKNTGEWDFEKLKSFDTDFLLDVGFNDIDLSHIWSNEVVQEDEFDIEEELEQLSSPTTRLGDIISLGKHKIICGDSTDPPILQHLFKKKRASVIYSDPVYNINLDYAKGIGGKRCYGGNVCDTRSDEEYKEFLRNSLVAALAVSHSNVHVFYWCDQTYIWLLQTLYKELGIDNKRVVLWIKNSQNPTPRIAFNKCYEPCVYGVRGTPYISPILQNLNEVMNQDIGTGNAVFDDISDLWMEKRISSSSYEHATSKPPHLHQKAIQRCSRPGDIILDSFLGSGSTLIAAETLQRTVYGVELEPRFCDLIIKRYQKLTGDMNVTVKNIYEEE